MVTDLRQQSIQDSGLSGVQVTPSVANTAKAGGTIVAPTVAPVVPDTSTKTTTPASSPTPVVTTTPAINDVNKISGTVQEQSAAIQAQLAQKQAQLAAAQGAGYSATDTIRYDASGNIIPKTATITTTGTGTDNGVGDQPDPGHMFIYDKATGARTEVAQGSTIPSTATTIDVNNAGAADTVSVPKGSIKQFSDGSYGLYDSNGKYVGAASAQDFSYAKGAEQAINDIQSIKNGTYPLNAGQQAQIQQIMDYYNGLIETQRTVNANVTGNTAGLQNLYGVGGSSVGISEVNRTIQEGSQKIAQLNQQMLNAINGLESALKTDNLNTVNDLYDKYKETLTAKSDQIDQMHNAVAAAAAKADTDLMNYTYKASQDHPDAGIDGTEKSVAEINAKVLASGTFKEKQALVDTTPVDGNRPDPSIANIPSSVTGKTPDALWQDASDYNLSGKSLQTYVGGLSSAAQQGSYKSAISNKSAEILKAAGVSSKTVLQQEYKANSLSLNQLTKNMNAVSLNVQKAEDGVNQVIDTFSKSGINTYDPTLLNKTLNQLSQNLTDSAALRAYKAGVYEVSNDYAQVFTRGGQRNQQADDQAQAILSGDITLKDFIAVTNELQAQGQLVVQDSIKQMQQVANGNVDEVVKYLNYINNAPTGAVGDGTTTSDTNTDTSTGGSTSGGSDNASGYTNGGAF